MNSLTEIKCQFMSKLQISLFFFDNINSGEVFLIFPLLDKIMTKDYYKWNLKFLQITCLCFGIINGHKYDNNDDKYDSKFLFYNFNDCLNKRGLPVQYEGHTIISEERHTLLEL